MARPAPAFRTSGSVDLARATPGVVLPAPT
jgi:hypothetical protein